MSVFEKLNSVNVNDHTEKKNGLTYLSWAWAWAEIKKAYPDATYTIYENADGWFYHTDGKSCWVKTGMTIEGLEYIEYLPVMDYRNRSIPADLVTSMDVNKAIQRSLTKCAARHGLGLYIYAGEDLPESTLNATLEKAVDLGVQVQDIDGTPSNILSKMEYDKVTAEQVQAVACRSKIAKAEGVTKETKIEDYSADLRSWVIINWNKIVKTIKEKEGKTNE